MISPEKLTELLQSTEQHCLTLYFNTGPNLPRTAFRARFHNLLRGLDASIRAPDRRHYDRAVERVTNFLEQYQPSGNSFIAYASEKTWQEFHSRVPVRDEVHWGKPDTGQLLWLLEQYRPYGVLIADKQCVRFLAVRMNEFEEYREFKTEVDTKDWRSQVIGSSARGEAVQKGGADARAFDNRYMEHVRRFWRSLNKPLEELTHRYHIRRIVVAGNKTLAPEFARSLPQSLAGSVVATVTMDAFTSPTEAVQKIYPEILAWEEKRSKTLVDELLNAAGISARAAVGIEPVLKYIQDGRVARLIAARGLDGEVSRCGRCSYVSVNSKDGCSRCSSSEIRRASLAASLPALVASHRVPIEVVGGGAADELMRNGGIGVFLRF